MDTYITIKDYLFKSVDKVNNELDINDTIIEPKINTFIKCLLIGSSGVGKSSILERYTTDNFYQHFISTIGVDYRFKDIVVDNYNIKLQLWDTASQERFRCITTNYYRNSHIIIICYDITDINSFNDLDFWINDATKNLSEPVLMAICGTKIDLVKNRAVSYEDAKSFADYKNLQYFEISSKNNDGIDFMFNTLIKSRITEKNFITVSVKPEILEVDNKYIQINKNDNNYFSYCC